MDRIQNPKIAGLVPNGLPEIQPAARTGPSIAPGEFQSILDDRLKVSGHAQTRMQSRNIQLEPADWDRVMKGVDKAAEKGAKESLVLVDDVALVVSIKNRTVITAVDRQNLKENVFTNIDSAVVV